MYNITKTLLKFLIAGVLTAVLFLIFNTAFYFVATGLENTGFEKVVPAMTLLLASAISYYAFQLHDATVNFEEIPIALVVLAIVSLIGVFFEPLHISFEAMDQVEGVVGSLATRILLLSYVFLAVTVSERIIT